MMVAHNLTRTEFRKRTRDARRQLPLELAADVEAPVVIEVEVEYEELARAIHRAILRRELGPYLRLEGDATTTRKRRKARD